MACIPWIFPLVLGTAIACHGHDIVATLAKALYLLINDSHDAKTILAWAMADVEEPCRHIQGRSLGCAPSFITSHVG